MLVCAAQCTACRVHTDSGTLMQRLTFAKGGQIYLSHVVSELGGSLGQRFQTHKEITLWCFFQLSVDTAASESSGTSGKVESVLSHSVFI